MSTEIFHGLQSEHICFKELSTKDVQEIHSYASDENVKRFIGWPLMKTLEDTHKHIEEMIKREAAGTHFYASIILKSTQKVIGTAIIFNIGRADSHAEIGYVFHSDYWGKGYGTETVSLLSDFGFGTLNLHRLHACVVDVNVGSARVLEKNGFELEGRQREHYFIDGAYHDSLLFGKLK